MSAGCKRSLVIGCAVLERELRHLVDSHADAACPVQTAAPACPDVELRMIEQGLHERPEHLRQRLQSEIDRADGQYDRIILAYGLCSNGLSGIRAGRTPLLVPRAHDCITLLLGSRQRYRDYFDRNSGTYWYSAGWIESGHPPGPDHIERKRAEFFEKYEDEDTVEYLLDEERRWIANYSRACFIRQELSDESAHIARTQAAADGFGWTFDLLDGDLGLLHDLVSGCDDPERLLLIPPGSSVAPSYDERVVTAT